MFFIYPDGGGGVASPLFEFNLRGGTLPKRWKNVVNKTSHTARLEQMREATRDDRLGEEMTEAVHRALLSAIGKQTDLREQDRVHFTMQATAFTHCFQSTQFEVAEIRESTERLATYLHQLTKQLNSSQSFSPGDDFSLDVTTIRMPGTGGAPKKYHPVNAAVRGIVKRTRVLVKNKDELCCARAIVTMRAWADEQALVFPPLGYETLRKGRPSQERQARQLLKEAGVGEGPCGLPELAKLQTALPEYQLKVLKVGLVNMIVFAGPEKPRRILLLLEDEHYDGCTSFAGWFNKTYYCHTCDKGYNEENMENHRCEGRRCTSCHEFECRDYESSKVNEDQPRVTCQRCHREFMGPTCLTRHTSKDGRKKSTCDKWKKCEECRKVIEMVYSKKGQPVGSKHKCYWAECAFCKKNVPESDDDPETKKVPGNQVGCRAVVGEGENGLVEVEREPPLFVYADYEAVTDVEGVQSPILIGYETSESDTTHFHYGETCTAHFMRDMESLAVDSDGDDRRVIVLFHNLKGYDGMFLLQYLYAQNREVNGLLNVGVKVLSFRSDRLTFKDSLCFLPFSLASFPATFGLTELCKGFFPHLFNTLEHQSYVGPLPAAPYYDPDGMNAKKREEFLRWHEARVAEDYVFDLKKDMKRYCESDVKLLKAGCEKFVAEFKKEAKFDPTEKCITIASACIRYWRKCLLEPKTMAVQPPNGWKGAQTVQSFKARRWLSWVNHTLRRNPTEGDRVQYVDNGGEVRVATFLVDGYDALAQTVYEFNGCFFHGCVNCFPKQRLRVSKARSDRSFNECFDATLRKRTRLEEAGYRVISKWECDWDRERQDKADVATYLAQHPVVAPLEPRDAFFGGRTNAVKLHHRVTGDETVKYQDVTSLYPWVNKYGLYPTRHPTIITNVDHTDVSQYFGLAKVTVLPPFGLYHPVLPCRNGGKLTFPLCRTCVEVEMPKELHDRRHTCPHSPDERALTGTSIGGGRDAGVRDSDHPRGVAFPRKSATSTTLWSLREYVAEEQNGGQRLPALGHHARRQGPLPATVPPERRHHPGRRPDGQEPGPKSHGQTYAQFILG